MTTTVAPKDLFDDWRRWHAAREQALTTPHGWLSLVGFHWLPDSPTALPGLPGAWSVENGQAVLQAGAADGLTIAGGPAEGPGVDGTVTATVAEAGSLLWIRRGDTAVELVLRGGRYAVRIRDPRAAERAAFHGVPAFPVEAGWILPGRFTAFGQPDRITVETARSDLRQQVTAVGTVDLEIGGRRHTLVATAGQQGGLNLSFTDLTNGRRTAPWRVVSTAAPDADGTVVVDFNRTVNLPFAFTEFGTCPAPVAGNHLPVEVTAGELAPIRVTGGGHSVLPS